MVNALATTSSQITIVGGGPCGMTSALLLARAGHKVTLLEGSSELGGLWATKMSDGNYQGENSCKVYQDSYHTAPALFEMIGVDWKDHFHARHDLRSDWIFPFLKDCSAKDIAKISWAFGRFKSGARDYKDLSVEDWLHNNKVSESCQSWLRATALGGITGTLKMTVWEMLYRFSANMKAVADQKKLHWNRQPPNAKTGFIPIWQRALNDTGIEIHLNARVKGINKNTEALSVALTDGRSFKSDSVFLALPPPALAKVLHSSDDEIAMGFGHSRESLKTVLAESTYEHLGITWFFNTPLQNDLPLGGHNVREGWHPILVQHSQYEPYLKDAVTSVVASVSLDTDFVHPFHGTKTSEHSFEEIAQILWEDEQRKDPGLHNPSSFQVYGRSTAT
jgi:predicted NAD/FAD-dependent oxidoreductase